MKISKKNIVLAVSALALTATLTVGSALAYFTTYTGASGSVELDMGFTETTPHEEVDELGKHVTIENVGDYDCIVRVKAFPENQCTYSAPDGGWSDGGDGYWYYNSVLESKKTTETKLLVSYEYPEGEKLPDHFNIVVVQECAPVVYDDNNNPCADWVGDGTLTPISTN